MRKLKVLVVDDNAAIRKLIATFITEGGHEVLEAPGGDEALGLLEVTRIDVVVTDIEMPGMNGIQLAEKLSKKTPRPKIVLMSGAPPLLEEALKFPYISGIIPKPAIKGTVVAVVEQAMVIP